MTSANASSSKDKWLSLHTGKHWESFYLAQHVAAQKKFFNHFLRGAPNEWDQEPRVKIVVRDPRGERLRTTDQFPLPTTKMIRYYLDAETKSLASTKPTQKGEIAYDAHGPGVDFSTEPFTEDVEFTGFEKLDHLRRPARILAADAVCAGKLMSGAL